MVAIFLPPVFLRQLSAPGPRAARPGEFTERAFLNGKMDLIQAEAVIDLIRAKTDLALRSAMEQLEGSLGRGIGTIREELIDLTAHIEASLDFADEDIAPDEGEKIRARLRSIMQKISANFLPPLIAAEFARRRPRCDLRAHQRRQIQPAQPAAGI